MAKEPPFGIRPPGQFGCPTYWRLRWLRAGRKASWRVVLDVDRTHLNSIEEGRRSPSPALLERMADGLRVPYATLYRLLGLAWPEKMAPQLPASLWEKKLLRLIDRAARAQADIAKHLRSKP